MSGHTIRVAWLAPFPVEQLAPAVQFGRAPRAAHACSWIVNLSNALSDREEVELHVVTESTAANQRLVLHRGRITFHVVPSGVPFLHRGYPRWCPLDLLAAFRRRRRQLLCILDQIAPALVHGHGTEAAYGLAAVDSGRPALISIQGIVTEYYKTNPSLAFRVVRRWEQEQVRRCRFFTCRTDFDADFVRSCNPQARIFQIHEAMNSVFFQREWQARDSADILYVGSLEQRKGLVHLLAALAQVKKCVPAVRLQVVGGGVGRYTRSLHALVKELGLAENVVFHGRRTAVEIADFHHATQIFVLPSQNENSPNTLAEAMVSGLPVVATRVGGIPSMVEDKVTGLLVPWAQPDVLAERILWLLKHPEEGRRLGANARRVARERHAPPRVAEQTLAAYREILQNVRQS